DQGVAQTHPGVLLLQQSLFQLIRGDQPVPEEEFAELVAGGCCGGRMQLVGNEPTNIGIGGGVVKAEAVFAPKTSRKDATIRRAAGRRWARCQNGRGCQTGRVGLATRRSAARAR